MELKFIRKLSAWYKAFIIGKTEKNKRNAPAKPISAPPEDLVTHLQSFLESKYQFRYNVLTEQAEYKHSGDTVYHPVGHRMLNTFCIEAHEQKIPCWDRDISRLLQSNRIPDFHPFLHYMHTLPTWDGTDRVSPLVRRVSEHPIWINGFHRWLLGVAAQWSGQIGSCANALAPLLISQEQGMRKSTFCKMLIPNELSAYYLDKFDLNNAGNCEQKLALFGLINMDEFDRYGSRQMPMLKNLMQMSMLNFRKAYHTTFSHLPRIASFIGTSNQRELLTDPTGSRRFLCVEVCHKLDCTPPDHAQLFAQLKEELKAGERYWFSKEEELELQKENQRFYKQPTEQEVFSRCFRIPKKDEPSIAYTTTEIFEHLKKHHPSAMQGITPTRLGRTLAGLGMHRIHTERGNAYKLLKVS